MYLSRRMTDGSLRLNETARISLSYTEMTSTFPWHQSVTAFCQWTILSGSYDAFRRSVCSKLFGILPDACRGVKVGRLQITWNMALRALCGTLAVHPIAMQMIDTLPARPTRGDRSPRRRRWALAWALALGTGCAACASTGAVPRPFPMPGQAASMPRPSPAGPGTPVTSTALDGYALAGTALALRGVP